MRFRRARSALSQVAVPLLVASGLAMGFGREIVLAYTMGASRDLEIFRVAYALPSILSEAVAVSFVSALIPQFFDSDRRKSIALVARATLLVALLVTLLGVVSMPLQAHLLAPGFSADGADKLVTAGRLCWLMTFFFLLSYPLRAMMSAEDRIWPGSAGTLLRNVFFVLGLLVLVQFTGRPSSFAVGAIACMTGVATFATYYALLGRFDRREWRQALRSGAGAGRPRSLVLVLLTTLGSQILLSGGRTADRFFSSSFPPGSLAAIEYSYAITMALASLVGTSLNLKLIPSIARSINDTGSITRDQWRRAAAVLAATFVIGGLIAPLSHSPWCECCSSGDASLRTTPRPRLESSRSRSRSSASW